VLFSKIDCGCRASGTFVGKDSNVYVGKYLFKFDDAIVLGCCSGARTTTASLGMINDRAKSQIPGLGYTVTYAVGNTLLTIWGMVIVMLMT